MLIGTIHVCNFQEGRGIPVLTISQQSTAPSPPPTNTASNAFNSPIVNSLAIQCGFAICAEYILS